MDKQVIKKLIEIVGSENLSADKEELLCYSYDATGREFLPEAVVFPGTVQEVSSIMKLASNTPFSVVPRGAGSGMTGGALPVQAGVVLAMSRFSRILEIDPLNQSGLVEPGVVTGDFQEEVKKQGLYYPPDPASFKFCTMGGNVAECAGGPSAVKYGVTRDYVRSLEVVLADGRIITTGVKTAKGVVGYDLTRLFVGSEGTLGIITKIGVRLIPLPAAKKTFLLLVDSIGRAAGLVSKILSKFLPSTLEIMDKTALGIVSDKIPFKLQPEVGALLLLELDGTEEGLAVEAGNLIAFFQGEPGIIKLRQAENRAEAEDLWRARRSLSPAAFQLKPHKINEDVVVPRTRIPDLVRFTEALARELNLIIFTFGHAGDGNIHVNIMLDKKDPDEAERGETATRRLFDEVITLGGTLSGEHGVGLTKSAFLALEVDPPTIEVMRGIKRFFDPTNVLNPGKIFP